MAGRFAHLLGRGSVRAEDDKRDDDKDDAKRAEDEKKRDDEMRRLEDDGKDTGETEEEKDARHAREDEREASAKDGEGDDDTDREDARNAGPSGRAYRRGIARCAAIFASPGAGTNPVLAAQFAFDSQMTRGEAIRALRAAPTPARADRQNRNPHVGPSRQGGGERADVQQMWGDAFARVVPAARQGR
jgi:hypothetical protein